MDFGIVPDKEISKVDFTLPPDTVLTYGKGVKSTKVDIRIGLPKWGRKQWVGSLYPKKSKEADFLNEYTKLFKTIELNAAFYQIPHKDLIKKWKNMVATHHRNDFLFLPKVSREVSHLKRLKDAEQPMMEFLGAIRSFGSNLGPILIQVGDNFPPKSFDILESFVQHLPSDLRFFIELRNEEWFSELKNREVVYNLFKLHNIGWVITDTAGRRDCLHMELPIPEVYIRFNGLGSDFRTIDYLRIDNWVDRLGDWLSAGLEKVYFIISQKDDTDTPELAQYAIERFNKKLGANIPTINWIKNASIENDSDEHLVKMSPEEFKEWQEFIESKRRES